MIALVVAPHGELRDGLCALLSTIPEIGVVSVTHNLGSALELLADHCPALAVLEIGALGADHLAQVESMKVACPRTKIIALVGHSEMVPGLEASGVDAIVMQGAEAHRLTETISVLLGSENGYAE